MNKSHPEHRSQTIRQAMIELLGDAAASARDISQALSIQEKDIYGHLTHIDRSLDAKGKKLAILPARCLSCGFVFNTRKRFARPGRCPVCKQSHIEVPMYRIDKIRC